jgi:hypothetical protein
MAPKPPFRLLKEPMKSRVTALHIAEHLGLGPSTVAHVLSGRATKLRIARKLSNEYSKRRANSVIDPTCRRGRCAPGALDLLR